MFIGKVVGSVWATVKWPQLTGLKLLAVQPYHLLELAGAPTPGAPERCHDLVVCADILDAGIGDDVVVAYGHAARCALEQELGPEALTRFPVDAAVVAIVDRVAVEPGALAEPNP